MNGWYGLLVPKRDGPDCHLPRLDRSAIAAWLARDQGRLFDRASSDRNPLALWLREDRGVQDAEVYEERYVGRGCQAPLPIWAVRWLERFENDEDLSARRARNILMHIRPDGTFPGRERGRL